MERFFRRSNKRYYEVEIPQGRAPRGGWPILIALHGYQGDMSSMMRVARRIAAGRMIALSLQGPNQFLINYEDNPKNYRIGFGWGTTWKMQDSIEQHHADLGRLIDIAAGKHGGERSKVFLLAFSQACSYNYRFAFSYSTRVRGVIAVCGGVPGDLGNNPRYRRTAPAILHIAATKDVWYSREKNLAMRGQLEGRAASLDFRFYNSTHRFPRRAIPYIRQWIQAHL